jgi:hypothetical protein
MRRTRQIRLTSLRRYHLPLKNNFGPNEEHTAESISRQDCLRISTLQYTGLQYEPVRKKENDRRREEYVLEK